MWRDLLSPLHATLLQLGRFTGTFSNNAFMRHCLIAVLHLKKIYGRNWITATIGLVCGEQHMHCECVIRLLIKAEACDQ